MAEKYEYPILIIGGNAKLWKLNPIFDFHAEAMRSAARAAGCLVVDGSELYDRIHRENPEPYASLTQKSRHYIPDGWRLRACHEVYQIVADYHYSLIRAVIALTPPKKWAHRSLIHMRKKNVEDIIQKTHSLLNARGLNIENLHSSLRSRFQMADGDDVAPGTADRQAASVPLPHHNVVFEQWVKEDITNSTCAEEEKQRRLQNEFVFMQKMDEAARAFMAEQSRVGKAPQSS